MDSPSLGRGRRTWACLAGLFAGAILVVCLMPRSAAPRRSIELCLVCGELGTADFIRNVILYVPLGLATGLLWRSVLRAGAIGAILSLMVELTQYWIPGRYSTLGDVVSNTSGAAVGGWMALSAASFAFADGALRTRLAAVASGVATLVLLATGLLVFPSLPPNPLFGNWTPQSRFLRPYGGSVLSVEIGDLPLPSARLADPEPVRDAFLGGAAIDITMGLGPVPERPASVFRLIGDGQREAIRIDVQGRDVLVTPRYRATDLRLARPRLRFPNALPAGEEGTPIELRISPAATGGYRLEVDGHLSGQRGLDLPSGWSVLLALRRGSGFGLLDLAWLTLLFTPVGWWTTRRSCLLWLPPLTALVTTPLWTPLLPTPPSAVLAALVALVSGAAVGRMARDRGTRAVRAP